MLALTAVVIALTSVAQPGTGGTFTSGGTPGSPEFIFTQGDFPSSETQAIDDQTMTCDIRMTTLPGNPRMAMQNIWAFRIEGVDTRERLFTVNQHVSEPGRLSSLFTITGPGGITGTALLVQQFAQFLPGRAAVEQIMYVRNTGNVPFQVKIFNYMDLDPNGSTNHATAQDGNFGGYLMTDGPVTFNFSGFGALREADPYGGPGWVRDKLGDADVDNLDGTGAPMNGNFTGAFQWTVNVPVFNGSPQRSLTSSVGINMGPVPSPGAGAMLLGAGLAATARRRRTA